jgi:hypothetical protein
MDFPTQKAAVEHCQDLVKRWCAHRQQRNRRRFTRHEVPITGEDKDFVEALFDRHPEHDEKLEEALGRGFSGEFCVAPSEYGSPCLCLLTQTRPLVEFSYRRAIREPDAAEGEKCKTASSQ